MAQMKRQVLKLASFFGVIATTYTELQLDPPESQFLNQKSVSLSFINFDSLLDSGIFDGVAKTLL
jgi:hypothetical protein